MQAPASMLAQQMRTPWPDMPPQATSPWRASLRMHHVSESIRRLVLMVIRGARMHQLVSEMSVLRPHKMCY